MKTNTPTIVMHAAPEQSNFALGGLALAGMELAGCRGKRGRTRGTAQRRSRRRNVWVPTWVPTAQR